MASVTLRVNGETRTSGVTSVDWRSYPILTYPDVPVLDIDLVGSPRDKPLGAGEAALAPLAGRGRQCIVRCDRRAVQARSVDA